MADSRTLRVLAAAENYSQTADRIAAEIDVRKVPGVKAQYTEAVGAIAANIGEANDLGSNRNRLRQFRLALSSASEAAVHLRRIRAIEALRQSAIITLQSKHAVVTTMLTRLIAAIEEAEARRQNARSP
jgi:four helix bundle protein